MSAANPILLRPPEPARPAGPLLHDLAPDFRARTTMGERSLAAYRGRWLVLFSHPADFTPVCTSEFIAFAKAFEAFRELGCDLLALSVDSLFSHVAWVRGIQERLGVAIPFPLIEDPSMAVARAYGMLHPEAATTATVRSTFAIDPEGRIRAILTYPMNVGRNVDEILRLVAALQTTDGADVSTPEGWRPGDEVMLPPSLDDALAANDEAGGGTWFHRLGRARP